MVLKRAPQEERAPPDGGGGSWPPHIVAITALEWAMVRWWSTLMKHVWRQARKARTATRPTATLAETR